MLVDDQVVARINQWVAVPEAREQMKKAMARMPSYRGMIEGTLRTHHLPVQLLGMVMAESRFDNEAQPNTPVERRSVGLWQLIPSTGRRLGLQVSPAMDERLEPRRATEAAAALMAQLFDRYETGSSPSPPTTPARKRSTSSPPAPPRESKPAPASWLARKSTPATSGR